MPLKRLPARTTPPAFDVPAFLKSARVSSRTVRFATGAVVFAQGAQANSVFFVQEGGVKLSVLSGTTRSRVNFFMNKFRKLGLIEYNGRLKVNSSLLSIVLHG